MSIQKMTDSLAQECLKQAEIFRDDYTEEDLFNASLVFSHFLINTIYKKHAKRLPQRALELLAKEAGSALHSLVLASTGVDLKKVTYAKKSKK